MKLAKNLPAFGALVLVSALAIGGVASNFDGIRRGLDARAEKIQRIAELKERVENQKREIFARELPEIKAAIEGKADAGFVMTSRGAINREGDERIDLIEKSTGQTWSVLKSKDLLAPIELPIPDAAALERMRRSEPRRMI